VLHQLDDKKPYAFSIVAGQAELEEEEHNGGGQ
jgi:hypothetical protein